MKLKNLVLETTATGVTISGEPADIIPTEKEIKPLSVYAFLATSSKENIKWQTHTEGLKTLKYFIRNKGVGGNIIVGTHEMSYPPIVEAKDSDELVNGDYILRLEGVETETTKYLPFEIEFKITDAVTDPVDQRPLCERKPTIAKILEVTDSYAELQFDGAGIASLRIKSGVDEVVVPPQAWNVRRIYFSTKRAAGSKHKVSVQGVECQSPWSPEVEFTIPGEVVVDPDPTELPDPVEGQFWANDSIRFTNPLDLKRVEFGFNGNGILGIELRLHKEDDTVISTTKIIKPLTNKPIAIFFDAMVEGQEYYISGRSTDFKSPWSNSAVFEAPTPIRPPDLPQDDGSVKYEGSTQIAKVTNGLDLLVSMDSSDRVKLVYPEFKQSHNGQARCRAFVVNSELIEVKDFEKNALKGAGLKLPAGHYSFYVYWLHERLATFEDYLKDPWYVSGDGFLEGNSAGMEAVHLYIQDKNPAATNEIKEDDRLTGLWIHNGPYLGNKFDLPKDVFWGITQWPSKLPFSAITDTDTALQFVYSEMPTSEIPDHAWSTWRGYPQKFSSPVNVDLQPGQSMVFLMKHPDLRKDRVYHWYNRGIEGADGKQINGLQVESPHKVDVAGEYPFTITNTSGARITTTGSVYRFMFKTLQEELDQEQGYRLFPNHPTGGEQCENGFLFSDTNEIRRLAFEKLKRNYGVTHPNQTWIIPDYFGPPLNGMNTGGDGPAEDRRRLMANSAMAKKNRPSEGESGFYAGGHYNYMNRMQEGYGDSETRSGRGQYFWDDVLDYQQGYIAMPDLKTLQFSWVDMEGVGSGIVRGANWARLPLGKWDLIRLSRVVFSYELNKTRALIAGNHGNGQVMWDAGGRSGLNKACSGDAHIGGEGANKNKIQLAAGGPVIQLDRNNPDHPQVPKDCEAGFPDAPHPGNDGNYAGFQILSKMSMEKDYFSQSFYAPEFYYISNGVRETGYKGSDKPPVGVLGNSEVSRYGLANAGMTADCDGYELRKPYVKVRKGKDGAVAIIKNIFAGLTEEVSYHIAGYGEIKHVGSRIAVFKL